MRFQSLRDFNLSMLGKQRWRFLTNPKSLVARVCKARYFKDGDFLIIELENNPIFSRSLLESQNLIWKGARRTIGIRETISICEDPWLPKVVNSKITTNHYSFSDAPVSSLFSIGEKA